MFVTLNRLRPIGQVSTCPIAPFLKKPKTADAHLPCSSECWKCWTALQETHIRYSLHKTISSETTMVVMFISTVSGKALIQGDIRASPLQLMSRARRPASPCQTGRRCRRPYLWPPRCRGRPGQPGRSWPSAAAQTGWFLWPSSDAFRVYLISP